MDRLPDSSQESWTDVSSPLRIIALFIALSETLASAAAVATDGTARTMLTSFAVSFPFVVLAVFVWLLVAHTTKLYAPNQYTAETTIEAFANATRRQNTETQLLVRSAVSHAVATAIGAEDVGTATPADVRDQIAANFDQAVEDASVTLARSLLIDGAENVQIAVGNKTSVQDFLDSAYFSLVPAVGPYTYGVDWVLVGGDHETLPEMGSNWAEQQGEEGDFRLLEEVGIRPGTILTAIRRGHRGFR
jgi:hypothetical protein